MIPPLSSLSFRGKKTLVRVDYNVPLSKTGQISDLTRIIASLPTLRYILDQGGTLILMSHLGRPDGKKEAKFSLRPCAEALSQILKKEVIMAPDCIGPEVEKLTHSLHPSQILMLENLRFYPAEEEPDLDPSFARSLAKLGNCYVNDAFGTAHRAHSSTFTIAKYFPHQCAMGLLMEKEVMFLGSHLSTPSHPFYALIGGAKVSSKLAMLHTLLLKVDALFIGGAMAYTFFKAQGIDISSSLYEESLLSVALDFIKEAKKRGVELFFPTDLVITPQKAKTSKDSSSLPLSQIISLSCSSEKQVWSPEFPHEWEGVDIGPKTIATWVKKFSSAQTIFWNGPFGLFEIPPFNKGTNEIAKSLAQLQEATKAITIVGGGDSVAAIEQLGLGKKFSHVSTGGGASLEYIERGRLPSLDALSSNQ